MCHKGIQRLHLFNDKILSLEDKPYLLFQSWLLDAIQYGVIAVTVYSVFLGFPGFIRALTLVFGFGFGMWLICETIGRIKEKFKD